MDHHPHTLADALVAFGNLLDAAKHAGMFELHISAVSTREGLTTEDPAVALLRARDAAAKILRGD